MATETEGEGAAAAVEQGSAGLPQLDFSTWPSQIFWLVVALVVLYQLMAKVALPRISSVLEERADAIADDLDKAEELRRAAEEAEVAYHQALADARREAQQIAAETQADIQKQVDAAMAKADAEISARAAESEERIGEIQAQAASAVDQVAKDTALALVEAILPEAADAGAVDAAVATKL
ncbi:MAG: F0F1 ATP synthase subunit B' [Pseudomonadota bacterium]